MSGLARQVQAEPSPSCYRANRERTLALAAPLTAEDQQLQSMPEASPTKWHLAHTTWFFETFLLEPHLPGYAAFHPAFKFLFNSYYEAVGDRHERPKRGLLSRPTLTEVHRYRAHVDEAMGRLLETGPAAPVQALITLGLHHEQQHQELILTDIQHALSQNPLRPAYATRSAIAVGLAPAHAFVRFEGGLCEIGHAGGGFSFDNEGPRHPVYLRPFSIGSRLVTCGEYAAFIADGGYDRSELWLSEGWELVRAQGWRAPLYWSAVGEDWNHFTLSGVRWVDPAEPVTHVSYFEADAYARWKQARLPSEAEWEVAAQSLGPQALEGSFQEAGHFHPSAAAGLAPLEQLFGEAWQWTQSAYGAYPGFRPAAGAVGEYNGKFMVNQYVLRGASCATPAAHARLTYRNFFPAQARWQFTGIRLAQDE